MADTPLWQKILVGVLVGAVILYYGYGYFLSPKIAAKNSLEAELKNIDLELKTFLPPDAGTSKDGIDLALTKMREELDEAMKKIPYESDIPYLLDGFISTAGRGLKTFTYNLIEPGGLSDEGSYKRLPLKLSFSAAYTDFNIYLMQLENLPTIIRVDNISIKTAADSPTLSYEMNISAFTMGGARPEGEAPVQKTSAPRLFPSYYKDPFMKVAMASPTGPTGPSFPVVIEPEVKLYGIWRGTKPRAFINQDMVGIGDKVNGYTVTGIYANYVTLYKNGLVKTLYLKQN
ncbi:MAG: type 4a pilus biogenesis protein PilO [bacterium]